MKITDFVVVTTCGTIYDLVGINFRNIFLKTVLI